MNSVESIVLAVALAALLTTVTMVALFAVFHRKIDQFYNTVLGRFHEIEKSIEGQSEKIAVIHHVATVAAGAPTPVAPAPPAKNG